MANSSASTLQAPEPAFTDSHAHLDGPEFDADRDEAIRRARDAGVVTILNVGTGDPHAGTLERALELTQRYEGIYAALGTHPHDARLFDTKAEERIETLMRRSSRVVAWGEIGLDYHYDHSPRDKQREVFRRQLQLAVDARKPVIVHTREAEEDTIAILREEWVESGLPGVMHCFSGSQELASECLMLGFFISFAGMLTFKNATGLREVARNIPLDRLLIETDCPYLSPEPYRGRRNEPARVVEVARCLADLRGIQLAEIANVTTRNFYTLFGLRN